MQPDVVQVATDALRSDAAIWDEIAVDLGHAADVADVLDLSAGHFSIIADWAGMTDLYREVQDRMVRLMRDGAQVHVDMADGLRAIANGFVVANEDAVQSVSGT